MSTFPVQLAIEVIGIFDDDYNQESRDRITLVAYVGSKRTEVASTETMTGYQAAQDPRACLRALLEDLLS